MKITYRYNLEIRRKSFKKVMKARERSNMTKVKLFDFIAKKMVTSKKTAIRDNKIRRKRKTKKLIKLV